MFGQMIIPLGRNAMYGQLTVETDRFTEHVNRYVFEYGIRQLINDAIAAKNDLSVADLVAKAQRRLDTLYSGELRVRNAAEPIDPVDAEVYRMAKSALTTAAKNAPEYPETKGEKDRALATINLRRSARNEEPIDWRTAVAEYEAKMPGVRKAAAILVRERAAAEAIDI